MRWDSQRVEREKGRSLPGLDVERVRTFDAPEALGINFHEVRAKSALNKVPGDYLPFNWTVNAFRGCTHACVYCQGGETPVLMADGRSKAIAELRVGDRIYGTARGSRYRHYVPTEVLAHWETYKEAYRVTLEDGTELIASGDHRYLSRRGKWKHVIGAQQGLLQRPHLTLNDELMGVGRFARGPDTDAPAYRKGYLCGLIRGDGNLGTYPDRRPNRSASTLYRFRLALADFEALRRAREYLAEIDLHPEEFLFVAAAGAHREIPRFATRAGTVLTVLLRRSHGLEVLERSGARGSWPESSTRRAATRKACSASPTAMRRSSIGQHGAFVSWGSITPSSRAASPTE